MMRGTKAGAHKKSVREAERYPKSAPAGLYMPIAWKPESTYSVVPVTLRASSERR
jgi:hypothetical protein